MIGIYEIKCLRTGNRFVSGSTKVKQAIKQHMDMLYYGIHPSKTLAYDFDAYLQNGFECNLLKQCSRKALIAEERAYLLAHKDDQTIVNDRDENGMPFGEASQNAEQLNAIRQNQIERGKNAYLKMLQEINNKNN